MDRKARCTSYKLLCFQAEDEEEVQSLRQLHDLVYSQACSWFQNLRDRFRSQILQHFGSMPGREENLQV